MEKRKERGGGEEKFLRWTECEMDEGEDRCVQWRECMQGRMRGGGRGSEGEDKCLWEGGCM